MTKENQQENISQKNRNLNYVHINGWEILRYKSALGNFTWKQDLGKSTL